MTVRRLSDYYRILRTLESQGDTEPLSSEKMSRLTGFTAPRCARPGPLRLLRQAWGGLRHRGAAAVPARHPGHRPRLGHRPGRGGQPGHGPAELPRLPLPGLPTSPRPSTATPPSTAGAWATWWCAPWRTWPRRCRSSTSRWPSWPSRRGEAQNVVDTVVGAGIKGILSFAPVKLQVPRGSSWRRSTSPSRSSTSPTSSPAPDPPRSEAVTPPSGRSRSAAYGAGSNPGSGYSIRSSS